MREIRRLGLAAIFAAATAVPAFGQTAGGSTGGSTGSSSYGGSSSGSSSLGGSSGGSLGSSSSSSSTTPNSTTGGVGIASITAPSSTTTNTNPSINSSNAFANTYANPYYQGRAGATQNQLPGGFGQALYGTSGSSGGTGGGQIGFAGTLAGTSTGASGGGRGGSGSSSGMSSQGGIVVPLPRQIAYSAQVRFAVPPVTPVMMQADLRGIIDRSGVVPSGSGVQVVVEGTGVILRGKVKDEDEAKLIEGLVRLTPGVGAIKNELSFPR